MEKINGIWWIPEGHRRFNEEKRQGTLYIQDNYESELEIIFYPQHQGVIARAYNRYDVIWGEDICGTKYTLFNCLRTQIRNFTEYKFSPSFILKGEHLSTLDVKCYNRCQVKYKHLKNWIKPNRVHTKYSDDKSKTFITIDKNINESLLEVQIDPNIILSINERISHFDTGCEKKITQDTYLQFNSNSRLSLSNYLELTAEFSQFLSIALFKEQNPIKIEFYNEENPSNKTELLFKNRPSYDPHFYFLIQAETFKKKLPDIIKNWHKNYYPMSCISRYLIKSFGESVTFDYPDFLIIAQALDGYFKRFINKKNGKDIRKYKDQIDILINYFKEVDAVKKCKFNSEIIAHSRNKYSHLYNDEEEKAQKAVDGFELYWLTQKCLILLTCCILHCNGMDIDEINTCCNGNAIQSIIDAMPIEYLI